VSKRQQPEDEWEEGWEDGPPEPAAIDATPVAVLKEIAANSTNDTARVQASKLLLEKGYTDQEPDSITVFDLAHLSGEGLDRELAGFFNPGWVGPTGGPDDSVALDPAQERELKRRLKRAYRQIDGKVHETARKLAAQMSPASSDAIESSDGKVVPIRVGTAARDAETERRAKLLAEEQERIEKEREYAEAKRQELPPAMRAQIPPGMSLEDVQAQFRGRGRRR
jgi:hypothetical protein